MQQSFWVGTHIENFLFKGYDVTSIWGLLATCLGVLSLAILYEHGRIYKLQCKSQAFPGIDQVTDCSSDAANLMASSSETTNDRRGPVARFCHAVKYAVLCTQNEFIGYILMLSVMTFNLAIALAVWLGAGLGYFVFAASISTPDSPEMKRTCSRQNSERTISSPPSEYHSSDNLAGNIDKEEEMHSSEPSQLPLCCGNEDNNDSHGQFSGREESHGGVVTSTVIVHREPSP